MDTMLKNAATDELFKLMDTLSESSEMSTNQADLLYSVVDELTERGEFPQISQSEIENAYSRMKAAILQQEIKDTLHNRHNHWLERALNAARTEQVRRKLIRTKAIKSAVAVAVVAILINAGTSLAWSRNFIGEFLQYAGQAFYSLFAQEPKLDVSGLHPEMVPLAEQLFHFGLDIKLPTWLPINAMHKSIEITYDEVPYQLTAWYNFWGISNEFSMIIGKDIFDVTSTKMEANEENGLIDIIHHNTVYAVYHNESRITVLWQDGDYQITLQGELTYEEVEAIILSIPE